MLSTSDADSKTKNVPTAFAGLEELIIFLDAVGEEITSLITGSILKARTTQMSLSQLSLLIEQMVANKPRKTEHATALVRISCEDGPAEIWANEKVGMSKGDALQEWLVMTASIVVPVLVQRTA